MSDPTLQRMAWSEQQVDAYAEAAARLCSCEGTCVCHWDDPDSLAMQHIERQQELTRRIAETQKRLADGFARSNETLAAIRRKRFSLGED